MTAVRRTDLETYQDVFLDAFPQAPNRRVPDVKIDGNTITIAPAINQVNPWCEANLKMKYLFMKPEYGDEPRHVLTESAHTDRIPK